MTCFSKFSMYHFANIASMSHWAVLAADDFMPVLLSWMICRIIYTVTSVLWCQAFSEINLNLESEIWELFQCHVLISCTRNLR